MSSKAIQPTDYRYGVGDKYGRAKCSNCHKKRRINALWKDTGKVLCTACSISPGLAFSYSIRAES